MAQGLDFTNPKSIRNWGIKLANSCGGAEVLANALLEQFAQAYNKQLIEGETDAGEEEE